MIIVTGAAGFIGSCFVAKLNEMGLTDLVLVDVLDHEEKKNNLKDKKYSDFIDKSDFIKKIRDNLFSKKCEGVFHIGACSSTMETGEAFLMENNVRYSQDLCKWTLEIGAPFHYASSAATYGDGEQGYSDDYELIPKLRPLNLYGKSKLLFDLWIIDQRLQGKVVGYKYFNVFGPNEYHKNEMRSVITKAYDQIMQTGKLRLFKSYRPEYKDGEQVRDFVYIKDVVEIMYDIFKEGKILGIYNLGTGKARTWNDLAKAAFSALNKPVNIEYIDMPQEIRGKYQYYTQADLSRLRQAGCVHKFRSLEESTADYMLYLKSHAYL